MLGNLLSNIATNHTHRSITGFTSDHSFEGFSSWNGFCPFNIVINNSFFVVSVQKHFSKLRKSDGLSAVWDGAPHTYSLCCSTSGSCPPD